MFVHEIGNYYCNQTAIDKKEEIIFPNDFVKSAQALIKSTQFMDPSIIEPFIDLGVQCTQ